ncbi:hypothetical protein SAMN04488530_10881 [Asaccharospora irregularis DSM 2635]|uniref:Uncharacterized protein n=1 Tax=Asaccharospora irregularis DSM 2635 TaxID=1121321 RepID=A0A1M5N0Q2_9FIRM|nr:hypothetical protein SAMN04488530_10881 [Asaccharospora irregularis DSM 2635]
MNNLSGIISFIFLLLYALLYIMRDLYVFSNNFIIRKYINKTLPLLTKCNSLFLIASFIFSLVHLSHLYAKVPHLNQVYIIMLLILFALKNTYLKPSNIKYVHLFNFSFYLLTFSLIIHLTCDI